MKPSGETSAFVISSLTLTSFVETVDANCSTASATALEERSLENILDVGQRVAGEGLEDGGWKAEKKGLLKGLPGRAEGEQHVIYPFCKCFDVLLWSAPSELVLGSLRRCLRPDAHDKSQ